MDHRTEYQDQELCAGLVDKIRTLGRSPARLMEVCGTHTMSIARHGLKYLLPPTVRLLSGPGCPVCVTSQEDIDRFVKLAGLPGVTVATFGDLLRVPGTKSSLERERAKGADVRVVGSVMDGLDLARDLPGQEVVFLGVGFETTAPTVAAAVLEAQRLQLTNFSVLALHKLIMPALKSLLGAGRLNLDGLLCPGHVSVVIGSAAYRPLALEFGLPCVVAGFEPADILQGVLMLLAQKEEGRAQVEVAYRRAVKPKGNATARELMDQVFRPAPALWRGLGPIRASGLEFKESWAGFDAARRFDLEVEEAETPPGCLCGQVLLGEVEPADCPLFGRGCTPSNPVGPCMVSGEGTCAALHRYGRPEELR